MGLISRIRCAITGHNWEDDSLPSGHSWCRRCQRYDDHPAVVRMNAISSFVRKWRPVSVRIRRHDVIIDLGWPWVTALPSLGIRLHLGISRHELPGVNVSLNVWRLRIWTGLGSGWQDEDGDGRSFGGLNVTFTTYGLRWIGCWLGHKPERARLTGGMVFCDRCDSTLELADADPRKAAAA